MSPPGAPSSELVPRLGVSPPVSCALPLPQLKRRVCHECVSTRAASAYDAGGAHDAAGPATGWRRTYGRLSLQRAAPRMARRGDPPHLHVYPARSLRVFHMPAQQCVFPASWYDSLFLQPLSDGWLHHKGWPSCFLYPQGSASDRGRTSCRRGKYVPFADYSVSLSGPMLLRGDMFVWRLLSFHPSVSLGDAMATGPRLHVSRESSYCNRFCP